MTCMRYLLAALLIPAVLQRGTAQTTGLPLDPRVEEMLGSVSSDTLFANLVTLVGFQTRHTNSDTVSDTVGIGAARRWIYGEFARYQSDPQTFDLEPSYFIFTETVCGDVGEHRNVLATLPGVATPERYYVVMGHLDSRNENNCDSAGYAPGANDDCSGTVVAMEMARIMSRYAFESTVVLMPVTGEEQGLLGSTAYAENALQTGTNIGAAITNDIVGNVEGCEDPNCPPGEPVIVDSTSVRHFSGDPATGSSRQLARYMKLQALRYAPGFTVNLIAALDRPGRGGDHIPFYDRGFPSARFTEANEMGVGDGSSGRQHNMFDTISAYNTNKGYMANIARVNMAGIASLALAPSTPAGLELFDGGDGESVYLTWPLSQTEGDFSGYMIALREPDSLYYTAFYDAGISANYTAGGLTEGQEVMFSIAAYDSSGNLSLFSEEQSIIPSTLPRAPQNLDATSNIDNVSLAWDPNTEVDIVRYRIYRSGMRNSGFLLHDSVAAPASAYVDAGLAPHMLYYYRCFAVDADGNESAPSVTVGGQLVTHDLGILVVDGTADGTGSVLAPTDAMVDDQYVSLLRYAAIGGHYDVADSNTAGYRIFDADLSPYSTVLWHTDVRGSSPLYQDTSSIRKYLERGGRLILSGWKLSASLQQNAVVGVNMFPSGSFAPLFLKIDSTLTNGALSQDFMTAVAEQAGYPDINVDVGRIPLYNGTLVNTDVVLPPFAGGTVDILYHHHGTAGSNLEGKPVGWRFLGPANSVIAFDFPLYYMETETARAALTQALNDLGEPTDVEEDGTPELPLRYALYQNFPNPFNPTTEIRFDLPAKGNVALQVYDILGRRVRTLLEEEKVAGAYRILWDGKGENGRSLASGVYFYEIVVREKDGRGETFRTVRTMVLMK